MTSDSDTAAVITYRTFRERGGSEWQANVPLPLVREDSVAEYSDLAPFSLVTQAPNDAITITCRIFYEGELLDEQTSSGDDDPGAYASGCSVHLVTCGDEF